MSHIVWCFIYIIFLCVPTPIIQFQWNSHLMPCLDPYTLCWNIMHTFIKSKWDPKGLIHFIHHLHTTQLSSSPHSIRFVCHIATSSVFQMWCYIYSCLRERYSLKKSQWYPLKKNCIFFPLHLSYFTKSFSITKYIANDQT